jgi:hypothetical protein
MVGVEYGRVREGIDIGAPAGTGERERQGSRSANGHRPADAPARRRRSNPLLAPGPQPAAETSAGSDPHGEPHRRPRSERAAAGSARDRAGGGAQREAAPGGGARPDAAAGTEPASAHAVVCTVGMCPICAVVTAMGEVRPELTEHLLLAGRELLLALKSLIDARAQSDEAPRKGGGLERIRIE